MHDEHMNCIWEIEVEQSSVDGNLNKSAVVTLVIYAWCWVVQKVCSGISIP